MYEYLLTLTCIRKYITMKKIVHPHRSEFLLQTTCGARAPFGHSALDWWHSRVHCGHSSHGAREHMSFPKMLLCDSEMWSSLPSPPHHSTCTEHCIQDI